MIRERRRFPRVPHPFDAQYRFYGELLTSWRTVKTLNLGAGGIRFRSPDPLEPGTKLELQITLPFAQEPLVLRGQVIWSQVMAPGVAENGIEFIGVSPEQAEQIDELVKFLMRSP